MGEVDLAGVLVLELFQAAARAAVAQAFPFGAGHLFQRLGFPEESLLAGYGLGRCGHGLLWLPNGLGSGPSRRCGADRARGRLTRKKRPGAALALTIEMMSESIGLWAPLG